MIRMKKRILSITLLFVLLCSTQSFAFSDVPQNAWYYNSVTQLRDKGLISGYADDTFKPQAYISNAEALKMVLSAAQIPVADRTSTDAHWASNYLKEALENDIVDSGIVLDKAITRQEVAAMVVKALNLSDKLPKLNNFIDTSDKNANILYSSGIIIGVTKADGAYFYPAANITRAEMSVILLKIDQYMSDSQVTALVVTDAALEIQAPIKLEEVNYGYQPTSIEELQKVLLYMASNGKYTFDVSYPEMPISSLKRASYRENLSKAYDNLYSMYPDAFSSLNRFSYEINGTDTASTVTITLKNAHINNYKLELMYDSFTEKAAKVVEDLIKKDKLTADMSDKDKARVLYDWVIDNTEYDEGFADESYTGYGQIVNKKAVCQGYTATFNYMCKLVGLEVYGITGTAGENHIWTVAVLDGEKVHIDTTWGDSSDKEEYFCATSEFMRKTHRWSSSKFGI